MDSNYDLLHRTYADEVHTDEWEVLSDSGFVDINSVLLTDPYVKYVLKTSIYNILLECADDHIVYSSDGEECYVKDLKPGDLIDTKYGIDIVKSVENTGIIENMYDIHVNSNEHQLYVEGILCHNSLVLSNVAVRGAKLGASVGVFTVELGDRKYVKRLGANLLDIPNTEYKQFVDDMSLPYIKSKIDEYKRNNPNTGTIHVKEFPTGSVSPIDLENYFLKYQEMHNMHFNIIVVDYINLLKPHKGSDTMYEKIKTIAEQLRAIAQRNDWCIVSATQVKAADFSTELHMGSAAESSGLIATVDSMFGLMGEPGSDEMTMKNLANRDAGYMESFKKFIKDQNHFRITEKSEADSEFYSDDYAGNLMDQVRKEDEDRLAALDQKSLNKPMPIIEDAQLVDSFSTTIGPNMSFDAEAVIAPVQQKEEPIMQLNRTNPVPYVPAIIDVRTDNRPLLILSNGCPSKSTGIDAAAELDKRLDAEMQSSLKPFNKVLIDKVMASTASAPMTNSVVHMGMDPIAELEKQFTDPWAKTAAEQFDKAMQNHPEAEFADNMAKASVSPPQPNGNSAADMIISVFGGDMPEPTSAPPTHVQPDQQQQTTRSMDDMLNSALGVMQDQPIPPELVPRMNVNHDDILKRITL